MEPAPDPRIYYASPGRLTDLSALEPALADLPRDLPGLVHVVQGLVLHAHWAQRYGLDEETVRRDEGQIRTAAGRLRQALALDSAPLVQARPPERRTVGVCSHFATLLTALLRRQGVPARARCGFGTYFEARAVDHWICEVWSDARSGWRRVDPQIDALQREALSLDFDPLDLPPEAFLVAGEAWRRCQAGEADPHNFGIFDMWGLWFIEGNVVRDLAALNKTELLPWDDWGLMEVDAKAQSADDRALVARAAELCATGDDLGALRAHYETNAALRVPAVIRTFAPPGSPPSDVEWGAAR